jgi:hypothetical protein
MNLTVQVIRPIPPIAYIPLAILWFGLGNPPALFLISLGAFFPVLMNTIAGVRQVDSIYLRAARNLGASQSTLFLRVMLPAAVPYILSGVRIGIGTAFINIGEIIAFDTVVTVVSISLIIALVAIFQLHCGVNDVAYNVCFDRPRSVVGKIPVKEFSKRAYGFVVGFSKGCAHIVNNERQSEIDYYGVSRPRVKHNISGLQIIVHYSRFRLHACERHKKLVVAAYERV